MQNQISPGQALQGYGLLWIVTFVMALITATCCQVFKVPIAEAVNVQLAVALAMDIVLLGIYVVLIGLLILMLQWQAALLLIVVAFMVTLLSLAPIAAFQLWTMFFKADLMQESFMYAMVIGRFQEAGEGALAFVGRFVGDGDFARYWPIVKDVVTTASGLIAIGSVIFGGKRQNA